MAAGDDKDSLPEASELAEDLRVLAQRRWSRSTGLLDVPGWGVFEPNAPLPVVIRELEPRLDTTSPLLALDTVLAAALARVRGDRVRDTMLSYARGVGLLFRIEGDLSDKEFKGRPYDLVVHTLYREAALPLAPDGSGRLQRGRRNALTESLRYELARVLRRLLAVQRGIRLADPPLSTVRDETTLPWVQRPVLEAQARRAAGRRFVRPLLLWGESGNGKTALARQLTNELFEGQKVLWLRGPMSEPAAVSKVRSLFSMDVRRALEDRGLDCSERSDAECQILLLEEIRTPGSYNCLVLDNFGESELRQICSDAAIPILATTRSEPASDLGAAVRVPAFERAEAVRLLEYLLPDETDTSALVGLADDLGYRPLALVIAGRMAQEGTFEIRAFRDSLRVAIPETIEASLEFLGEGISVSFVNVYRRLLLELKARQRTLDVLRLIAWWTSSCSIDYLEAFVYSDAFDRPMSDILLHASLRTLVTHGLLDQGDDGSISINSLTEEILRVLMNDDDTEKLLSTVYEALIAPANNAVETAGEDFDEGQIGRDLLARDVRVFPSGSDWQRYHRLQIQLFAAASARQLSAVSRTTRFGAFMLAGNAAFYWERGLRFLPNARSSGVSCGLLIPRSQFTEVITSGYAGEADPLLQHMLVLGLIASASLFTDLEGAPGVRASLLHAARLRLIHEPKDELLRHQLLDSAIPSGGGFKAHRLAWALCGALIGAGADADPQSKSPCPACAANTTGVPHSRVWQALLGLRALVGRLGDEASWEVAHRALTALAAYTRDNASLVAEAVAHARRGEAAAVDESAAALLLWTLVWQYEIQVRSGASAEAAAVRREIETRLGSASDHEASIVRTRLTTGAG